MRDFTKGSISKEILVFSVPMIIGNLFQQVYSLVDAIIVGRFVGRNALAAIGVSMIIIFFLTSVLMGVTTGAAVLISQYYGAKQENRLKDTMSVSVLFLICLTIVITVLGVIFAPHFLRLLDTDVAFFDEAQTYLRIIIMGTVFMVFFNMYASYLRALGDAKGPLYILIAVSLFNVVLTLIFVVVLRLGVAGAAVSTVISQMMSMILCYIYARRRAAILRVERLLFDKELCGFIIKYGAPAALQFSLVSLASLIIMRLVNSFGASVTAGITAATKIDGFATMPVATISMALSTFVAQNMGAGGESRAHKGLKVSLIFMLAFNISLSIFLVRFGSQIISLFINRDEAYATEIISIGQSYLNVIVVFYFLFTFLFAFNGFFRGVGDAVIAMAFPVISLTIRTISAYVLVAFTDIGPVAIAWSIPIGWGISSILSWIYYKKRLWVGKVAVKPVAEET